MTKEEAVEILSRPKSMKGVPTEILIAHNMAIQALEQDSWEDTIKYSNTIYELSKTLGVSYNFVDEKIKEIVTALKASPQKFCEDCISRQVAIDELYKMLHDCFGADDEELDAVITTLNQLPPVIPTEKMGHWEWKLESFTKNWGNWHCSECRELITVCEIEWAEINKPNYKYCPNCGAKMEVE